MRELVRTIPWRGAAERESDPHLRKEWLVTNGLGGYASGTVSGISTRRYHGLLVAALPSPFGRLMILNDLTEEVRLPDHRVFAIGGEERIAPSRRVDAVGELTEFRLEMGLPVWVYALDGYSLEKRLILPHRQNTVHVRYRLLAGSGKVRLGLRPAVHFRSHDAPVSIALGRSYSLRVCEDQYEISAGSDLPSLRLMIYGRRDAFTTSRELSESVYRLEEMRGYDYKGQLWSPGFFRVDLSMEDDATLVGSTEEWEVLRALPPAEAFRAETDRRMLLIGLAHPRAREGAGAELVLAADQFIITPAGRIQDAARARAAGDEVRTVIAGYHWFTDWGRDTMISLEGLTLTTGRASEAGWILRTFSYYIRAGLLPNMFPEGENEGLYHTADATLWYFHAIHRYLSHTGDRATLLLLLPRLRDIVDHHVRGTLFGIGVDPSDGLLRQGQEGYQLTWMDAKVEDWVVTPRRGKAVEINALWYNALCLLAGWVEEEHGPAAARPLREHAERARESFNRRFWYGEGGHLYDVVDGEHGDDPSLRPNQVFAISLDHPVLDRSRWAPVLEVVRERLLTPVGLRSLAPGHPDYKAKYYGDLRARDAAYHQGTVWAWLMGPFIDAWLKLHPEERARAQEFLKGFEAALDQGCVGSISEIFDAESPYTQRGCIAQAWSVAEVLRCWVAATGEHEAAARRAG
jgi:predicted glycogen debranching enzyme